MNSDHSHTKYLQSRSLW